MNNIIEKLGIRGIWLKRLQKDPTSKLSSFKIGRFQSAKDAEYIEYIIEHRSNVKKIWDRVFILLSKHKEQMDCCDIYIIDDLIAKHDLSKISYKEFYPYRHKFFPDKEDGKPIVDFKEAWNHHQKNNAHHWQYWIMWKDGESSPIPMDFYSIIEMLCDWSAMSLKFGDNPNDFYVTNRSTMLLHSETVKQIERFMPIFEEAVKTLQSEIKELLV